MKQTILLILLFIGGLALEGFGLGKQVRRSYEDLRHNESYLDSLSAAFGEQRSVPQQYRASFLIALSAYPELKNVPIHVEEGDLRTTMLAQPDPRTIFAPAQARHFRIAVDTLSPGSSGKLFSELPFEARIGIMAHELAHVLDYVKRDLGELIRYGVRYIFKDSRKKLEARTDRIAVNRGFGWQLLAFKKHLRTEAELSPSYKAFKKEVYLSHQDLRGLLSEHPDYSLRAAQR